MMTAPFAVECQKTNASSSSEPSESNYSMKDEEEATQNLQTFLKSLQTQMTAQMTVIQSIQTQMTVNHHQMGSITKLLNIPACECSTCEGFENEVKEKAATVIKESEQTAPAAPSLPSIAEQLPATSSAPIEQENIFSTNDDLAAKVKLMESLSSSLQSPAETLESSREEGKRGRKSKYFDTETKKEITAYAKQHGPTATARKFSIPTAVASYYYRKATNSPKFKASGMDLKLALSGLDIPKMDTSDDQPMPLSQQIESSSPGFLRGRGRGRPKLIGDELDAALVEYIVKMKKGNPHKNYNATTVMNVSKEYIKRHAPGLLTDDGGSVNLKNTWAIKLLNRINEREQELATSSNELNNPVSSLLSMDPNSADFALMCNTLVNQFANVSDLFSNPATAKLNTSNEENKDNAENVQLNKQSINPSDGNSMGNVDLNKLIASLMQASSNN